MGPGLGARIKPLLGLSSPVQSSDVRWSGTLYGRTVSVTEILVRPGKTRSRSQWGGAVIVMVK